MPFQIDKEGDKYIVKDDKGKEYGRYNTRKQATGQLRALYANVPEATKEALNERIESALKEDKPLTIKQPGLLDKAMGYLRSLKEGRRNSTGDADRLQQIHDLAVANGADCLFSIKETNGAYRWVLLSSNSFQDSDREIVSQKALEADVARTDKEASDNYGPLRWWHMGNPDPLTRSPGDGVDIGTCDFRAMHGRTLIESGTFKENRIGAAIAQHADTLAASIGFFHPLTEPDSSGVFSNVHVFERSVLPRTKASNRLTALTVTNQQGDQDMATVKEKWSEFVAMLGGDEDMAKSVVKQAEKAEAEADSAGLKFKEDAAQAEPVAETVKAEDDSKDDDAQDKADEMKVFAEKFMPLVEKKMRDMLNESRKEVGEKEAAQQSAQQAQIDALTAQLKQANDKIAELVGDIPAGVRRGYRASIAPETLTTKEAPNGPKPDPLNDMFNWMVSNLNHTPGA